MPALTLAGALALAGCGGGSDTPGTGDGDGLSAEERAARALAMQIERCTDAGNYWDGSKCVDKPEDTSAADAAKTLHGYLNAGSPRAITPPPDSRSGTIFAASSDLLKALEAARKATDGIGSEGDAQVGVMSTKGAATESADAPGTSSGTGNPATGDITNPTNAKYIVGGDFENRPGREKTHADEAEVSGSYAGQTGKYTCGTDDNCRSRKDEDGVRLIGTWTFAPSLTEPKYKVDDQVYAEYGWWLNEADGNTGARVGAWYGDATGTALTTASAKVRSASGTATYNGHAVGQAALYSARGTDNTGGAFTATAKLTADFDDNMLKGDITNFKVGGADVDWSVELMEFRITGVGVATGATDTGGATPKTKWTIGGSAAAAGGDWSASFYDDTKPDEIWPEGVTGGFHSVYENTGHMIGAFGAER